MESANKVLALMLGLIVVLIIVALVLGKIGPMKGKGPIVESPIGRALGLRRPSPTQTPQEKKTFAQIRKQTSNQSVSPVPSVGAQVSTGRPAQPSTSSIQKNADGSITIKKQEMVAGATTKGGLAAEKIPATGVSVLLYPLALAGVGTGLYLRKKSQ